MFLLTYYQGLLQYGKFQFALSNFDDCTNLFTNIWLGFYCDMQETQNFPMAGFVVESCPIEDPCGGAV